MLWPSPSFPCHVNYLRCSYSYTQPHGSGGLRNTSHPRSQAALILDRSVPFPRIPSGRQLLTIPTPLGVKPSFPYKSQCLLPPPASASYSVGKLTVFYHDHYQSHISPSPSWPLKFLSSPTAVLSPNHFSPRVFMDLIKSAQWGNVPNQAEALAPVLLPAVETLWFPASHNLSSRERLPFPLGLLTELL